MTIPKYFCTVCQKGLRLNDHFKLQHLTSRQHEERRYYIAAVDATDHQAEPPPLPATLPPAVQRKPTKGEIKRAKRETTKKWPYKCQLCCISLLSLDHLFRHVHGEGHIERASKLLTLQTAKLPPQGDKALQLVKEHPSSDVQLYGESGPFENTEASSAGSGEALDKESVLLDNPVPRVRHRGSVPGPDIVLEA
ncbi:hypothetical protein LTR28_006821 [Elasticomyces elasticus]|nr:hypothetical protein LTR28_006821 [Elasticomyces elasticus]